MDTRARLIGLLALTAVWAVPAAAVELDVGFSPDGSAERLVVQAIEHAQHEILMAAYSFTNKQIAKALVDAHRRGVKVRAVLDQSQRSEHYSAATFLAHAGVPVRIDSRHAIMHNKYLVIDGDTVETGSFNYTTAAAKHNAENALLIAHDAALAHRYAEDWAVHWGHAEPYAAP